jgi:hypothetical protein
MNQNMVGSIYGRSSIKTFSIQSCHSYYATLHLCQCPFYKIFVKFWNSKKISDGKSSHCLRLGELKTTINLLSDTGENHRAAASHCKLYPIMLYCVHLAMHRVETYNFWSSVVIGSDCTGSSTFSIQSCHYYYDTLHLCQCSFYKIFVKFWNSKKMYLKLF